MALIETLETVDIEDTPPVLNLQHLAPEVRAEIERFQREIERLEAGELEADDFKKFRLTNGVYGIRGSQDLHMVRVKIRFGAINFAAAAAIGLAAVWLGRLLGSAL